MFYFFIVWPGVVTNPPLLRTFIGLFYQPWMTDDDCGAVNGMNE
jgi:hypothetical protein